MTTPTQLQQLARETANPFVHTIWDTDTEYRRLLCEKLASRILTALEQVSREERKEAQADKARLEFLNSHGAYISHSRDGEVCNVWRFDEDGEQEPVEGYPQKCYYDFREAIDKARAALAAWKEKQP